MIPKIIHYCWFGGNPLNDMAQKCIESWKKYCPDYEIVEWNEKNFDIENSCAYVKEAYAAKKWAFVSDYVRLKVVFDHGGVYLDTDVEIIKPLDSLLEQGSFMGFDDLGKVATGLGFAAEAGHNVLGEMLVDYEYVQFLLPDGSYDRKACPVRNTETLVRMGMDVTNTDQTFSQMRFLPREYLCPIEYETGRRTITKNTYTIHHYSASWHTKTEKMCTKKKRDLIEKYGVEDGMKRYAMWQHRHRYWIWCSEHGFVQTLVQVAKKLFTK